MSKVYAFAANGTEECELFIVVDLLRRAKIDTVVVSVGEKTVLSSHAIAFECDAVLTDCNFSDADALFFPGGKIGSENLSACKAAVAAIGETIERNKIVSAICAAPAVVLGKHGFLDGKRATCYPSFERFAPQVKWQNCAVVQDGNFLTARGLGCAFALGFSLIAALNGDDCAKTIAREIQYDS